ncbi:zinc-binding dehydrogenase [Nitratireductor pacificus]|uniref:Putative zinc-binding dehydrogenase n=1 Tax=Nitratireductor pacificus pht-3B TaxID=391937 RepID=K2NA54_9HYPH|nr:zinc-binding dehydrogenase [Nitratireductor pacificus]EKF20998.1 putative zinc-binding dehydrogenase [Nitratireductor pacificus pht-3B]
MKAVYFEEHGPIEVLRYGDFPDPEIKPGWVKVAVRACGLNYLDVFSRRGMPGIKITLPSISGGDCAGVVAELGEGVTGWKVGDRVLVNPAFLDDRNGHFEMMGETRPGAMAEYCTCRAEQLIPIPDRVSDDDAAALPVAYGTAYRMLFTRGRLAAGEKILILGASGGVGTACVLLAKNHGAHVIAAAGSDEKCRRLAELGADETVNYAEEGVDAYARRTTGSLFRGGGFDVVVNFTGGDTWVPSLRAVRRGGRLLTCGATAGYDPKTDIRFIFMAEMDILGSTGFDREDIVACLDLVGRGKLSPVIDEVVPLSGSIDSIRRIEERSILGKIIVRPEGAR